MKSSSAIAPRVPLFLILVVYLLLGIDYSVTTPIFEAPDEAQHFFVVREIVEQHGLPVQRESVPERWQQEGSQPPLYYWLGALLTFWTDASDWHEFVERNPYAVQGDPLASGSRNVFLHSRREDFPWRGTALAVHLLRWLSLIIGAASIFVTYRLARLLFPDQRLIAIGAAAIHAFIPQFLFVSAAVNNDALATLLCGSVLWQSVRVARTAASGRAVMWLGMLVGLAALTKLSAAAMALVALGAVVVGGLTPTLPSPVEQHDGSGFATPLPRSREGWKRAIRHALLLGLVAFAVAGWWYARNLFLYGDVSGLNRMLAIVGTRTPPPDLWQLLDETEGLRLSFWGVFGWFSILMPREFYLFFDGLTLIALLGLSIALFQQRAKDKGWTNVRALSSFIPCFARPSSFVGNLALPALTFFVVLVGVLRWGTLTPGLQGRLLFPALCAMAVILSVGLASLSNRFAPWVVTAVAVVMILIAALVPSQVIAPAYARPSIVVNDGTLLLVRFGQQIDLLKVETPSAATHPGGDVSLTFHWLALQPMNANYTLFIKVFGEGDELLASADTYPGFGMLPTTQWPVSAVVVDRYHMRVEPSARVPTYAKVVVGFYERTSNASLVPYNREGQRATRPIVARVKLTAEKPAADVPSHLADANFSDQVVLRGYDLNADGITLYWQARQPLSENYTVFIHALDQDGQLIAQNDGQPRNGDYPTSVWDTGEVVKDVHVLAWPPRTARVAVGLYVLETGVPLPLVGQASHEVIIPLR